jgi:hypothetical protein
MGFLECSISSLFRNKTVFEQAENQNGEDGAHQISFKINEKCYRNFKLSSQVIM